MRREREFPACVGGNHGVAPGGTRGDDAILDDALEFQDFAREDERIAGREPLREIFLDLTQQAPGAQHTALRAAEMHLEHRRFHDRADVHPVGLCHPRVGDPKPPVLVLFDLGKALVGLERIAAIGRKLQHAVEILAGKRGIGRGGGHFREEIVRVDRLRHGHAEHMLGEHVERALALCDRILLAGVSGIDRRAAFEHLETVRGHEQRLRWLVEPVIGAADTLEQAARALRRADIDDEIDIAPVNPEIERRGADDGIEPTGSHRGLDLAALADIERAVMQRDAMPGIVDLPEHLEHPFGLHAGVDEDQRELVRADLGIDFRHRVAGGMTGPRQPLRRFENAQIRLRRDRRGGFHEIGEQALPVLRRQPAAEVVRLRDRRGKAEADCLRRKFPHAREIEREEIAALARRERVQFIDNDAAQIREKPPGVGMREDQRDLFRRCQQDIRWQAHLPLATRSRGIPGARLHVDRKRHLRDRRFEIAGDIDRQRLQRRNVERMHAARPGGRLSPGEFHQRGQKTR